MVRVVGKEGALECDGKTHAQGRLARVAHFQRLFLLPHKGQQIRGDYSGSKYSMIIRPLVYACESNKTRTVWA